MWPFAEIVNVKPTWPVERRPLIRCALDTRTERTCDA
jgi:hypothetical protein